MTKAFARRSLNLCTHRLPKGRGAGLPVGAAANGVFAVMLKNHILAVVFVVLAVAALPASTPPSRSATPP